MKTGHCLGCTGEEVSGLHMQPARLCGALPGDVPPSEERHGGTVWPADGICAGTTPGLLCRITAALHPHRHACEYQTTLPTIHLSILTANKLLH